MGEYLLVKKRIGDSYRVLVSALAVLDREASFVLFFAVLGYDIVNACSRPQQQTPKFKRR